MSPIRRVQLQRAASHFLAFLAGLLTGDLLFQPETLTPGEVGGRAVIALGMVAVFLWRGRLRRT